MNEATIAAQQFFPTYSIDDQNKDIVAKEYEAAARTLASEERIFAGATGLAAVSVGFLSWLAAASYDEVVGKFSEFLGHVQVVGIIVLVIILFSLFAIVYFSELQRSLVYAARKVIVLRRMLGVNYGRVELVLPSRRIEGADDPFAISMFPGWGSYKCFPIYLITGISAIFLVLISARYSVELGEYLAQLGLIEPARGYLIPYAATLIWIAIALGIYRRKLADRHENLLLCVARIVGRVTFVRVVDDVESVIYRARLGVIEAERLRVPVDKFFPIIMQLEDRRFFDHLGISPTAIASAIWRYVRRRKRSGGSTITQQLARSLFLRRLRPAVLRKLVELILALWLERCFSKIEILKLYVCSVRYETHIVGVTEAVRHFFSRKPSDQISTAEIFFLAERISNVRSNVMPHKIAANVRDLREAGLLQSDDVSEIIRIYESQVREDKLKIAERGTLDTISQLLAPHRVQ
jgi:penicillin-binding protein 1A